jgi:glyoxylase-like metal-dependent hydrolase (beta-lactamase superfamily II)
MNHDEHCWPVGLHAIRCLMNLCHVLVDEHGVVIIDTGLPCDRWLLQRGLRQLGIKPADVRALVLTHGHLDHTGNLAWLKSWCGAPIYAHPLEQSHIDGTFSYAGAARWCGRLEQAGRTVFGYTSAKIDVPLANDEELPFWGGLRVIHLPGHTDGHCGFYSEKHRLLFSGDLFASYWFSVHLPPGILNSSPEKIAASIHRAASLETIGFLPNHYDFRNSALHLRRFRQLRSHLLP